MLSPKCTFENNRFHSQDRSETMWQLVCSPTYVWNREKTLYYSEFIHSPPVNTNLYTRFSNLSASIVWFCLFCWADCEFCIYQIRRVDDTFNSEQFAGRCVDVHTERNLHGNKYSTRTNPKWFERNRKISIERILENFHSSTWWLLTADQTKRYQKRNERNSVVGFVFRLTIKDTFSMKTFSVLLVNSAMPLVLLQIFHLFDAKQNIACSLPSVCGMFVYCLCVNCGRRCQIHRRQYSSTTENCCRLAASSNTILFFTSLWL